VVFLSLPERNFTLAGEVFRIYSHRELDLTHSLQPFWFGCGRVAGPLALGVAVVATAGCSAHIKQYGGVSVAGTPLPRGMTHDELVRRSAGAVAVVETDVGRGMGFVIDPSGFLITNRHVIEDASHVTAVRFPALDPPREYESVEVIYIDSKRDLALLQVNAPEPLPRLPLATQRAVPRRRYLDLRDPVFVFHAALEGDGDLLAHTGEVSDLAAYNRAAGPGSFVGVTMSVRQGQSGGPVVDRHGRAIGILTWTWKDKVGAYAIPIDEAAKMLAERPQLGSRSEHQDRAAERSREFLVALGRGDVEDARRLTSPSHARHMREESMREILGTLNEDSESAFEGFLGALDALLERPDRVRFAQMRNIVARTGTPTFRDAMRIESSVENGQVLSLFFELGQAYLSARSIDGKSKAEALGFALRRLQTIDAARTFALAQAIDELAGREIEIESVDLVPGAYSPRAVISLRVNVLDPATGRSELVPARVLLHMRLEWGDWYVAAVGPTHLTDRGGIVPG